MPHDETQAHRRASKIDPRLAMLLGLPPEDRVALKRHESAELKSVMRELKPAIAALRSAKADDRVEVSRRLGEIDARLFAPITTGFHEPGDIGGAPGLQEPHISAFIVSDASAHDLASLGVTIRSQAGDIFTAFIPMERIEQLRASPAIRHIELARAMFPSVNTAVQRAQIDALRAPPANATGVGTVVGIIDSSLDIHHPDFRDSVDDHTRVRFLWDQTLTALPNEHPPATLPYANWSPTPTYGVEYSKADIDAQLDAFTGANAYSLVRHYSGAEFGAHGTAVAGIAVGNGRAQTTTGVPFVGAAPGAQLIFVAQPDLYTSGVLADITQVADAFTYVFERAASLNAPCVANLSHGDNLGPHDGTAWGEQFLDALLEVPGRAITLSAGNSTSFASHAQGTVAAGATKILTLDCQAGAIRSDAIQIWYDGHDRFEVTLKLPGGTTIGPVIPGAGAATANVAGVTVHVTSDLQVVNNGDNVIEIIFAVPAGNQIPPGAYSIELRATTVVNGAFHAWADRNNRPRLKFTSDLEETTLTLGTPGTARRCITVGSHNSAVPPVIAATSGRGPSRDGRVKPEIAAMGMGVNTTCSRNRNGAGTVADNYGVFSGTSASAPLVAGACASLFQCRGAGTTWAQLMQILEDTSGTANLVVPDNGFGFGYVQIGTGCSVSTPTVDVWLRDHVTDTGQEPFSGGIAWLSPDIEVLDTAGVPVLNPVYVGGNQVTNIIRISVRNRGTAMARNTEVHFYWADPATNIPYPTAWKSTGVYTRTQQGFVNQANTVVIPQLQAGQMGQVEFGWAPPPPGSNIRGDDHFCLLVRLENGMDPSRIGAGGWATIATRNNVGMRNVHVMQFVPNRRYLTRFFVVGTGNRDSLTVTPDLAAGEVGFSLPLQALPWRDLERILSAGGPRRPFSGRDERDNLADLEMEMDAETTARVTGVLHARRTIVAQGRARFVLSGEAPLVVPDVRLQLGASLVGIVTVNAPEIQDGHRFVHVAQRSGGQLMGGISLELRP